MYQASTVPILLRKSGQLHSWYKICIELVQHQLKTTFADYENIYMKVD